MQYSSGSFDGKNDDRNMDEVDDELDDFFVEKQELQPQGVDPRRGWGFRGVHKVFDTEFYLETFSFFLDIPWIVFYVALNRTNVLISHMAIVGNSLALMIAWGDYWVV